MQCVAMCYSHAAVCCSCVAVCHVPVEFIVHPKRKPFNTVRVGFACIFGSCSVLRCVAVTLQCVAILLQCVAVILQCVNMCCGCVAVCCNVLQCVAVCCSVTSDAIECATHCNTINVQHTATQSILSQSTLPASSISIVCELQVLYCLIFQFYCLLSSSPIECELQALWCVIFQ